VDSTGDDPDALAGDGFCATAGAECTLRAAIEEANVLPGAQAILFAMPESDPGYSPAANVWRITPATQLPGITGIVTLDARTQPNYDAVNRPVIHIDGSGMPVEGDGLELFADESLIAGLSITGFTDVPGGFSVGSQILVNGGQDNEIVDNFLGLDPSGQVAIVAAFGQTQGALPTVGYRGLWAVNATSTSVSGNVISGNSVYGVHIRDSEGTSLTDNLVGTSPDGSQDRGNLRYGVYVQSSPNTSIGQEGAGNVISGNGSQYFDAGVFVFQPGLLASGAEVDLFAGDGLPPGPASARAPSTGGTNFLDIRDNRIGTNAACTGAVPNVNGVIVVDAGATRIDWETVNVIGNTISGNGGGPSGPPAAFPDLLKAQGRGPQGGGPVIAGDGFVWGAPSPSGPVNFTDNMVGADCDGQDPIPNQGRGAIIGLQVSSNTPPVPLGGAAPSLVPIAPPPEWFIEANYFLANVLDCIDIDLFFDLFYSWDELSVFLAFLDNALRNCGEDGMALSILLDSLSAWGEVILEFGSNEFSGNGGDGLDVEFNGSPGDGPDVNVTGGESAGNGGAGLGVTQWVNEYTVIAATGGAPPDPPRVNISGMAIHDNDGAGLAIEQQQPPLSDMRLRRGAGGSQPGGASVTASTFYDNGGLAIDLGDDGVTENDNGTEDADQGPNGLVNFPVLTSAVGGSVTIAGTYDGDDNKDVELRFYSNTACDPSGNGEGQTFIGSHEITTDSDGLAEFEVTFDVDPPGRFITATATVEGAGTSEFSDCIEGEGIGGHLGDVDCDGGVDAVDALGVLRHVANLSDPPCLNLADVNCDTAVNAVDALGILRFVAGLSVNQEPSCPPIGP
jgi:CSLREA domain-containing protein